MLEFRTKSGKYWSPCFSLGASCPPLLFHCFRTWTALALGPAGQGFKPLAAAALLLLLPAPHLPRLLRQGQGLALLIVQVWPSYHLHILIVVDNCRNYEDVDMMTWKLVAVLSLAMVTLPTSSFFCMGTCTYCQSIVHAAAESICSPLLVLGHRS